MTAKRSSALVSPEQLTAAIVYLEEHGWARHGVVLLKDDRMVTLTFTGELIVDGDKANMPPELLAMFRWTSQN